MPESRRRRKKKTNKPQRPARVQGARPVTSIIDEIRRPVDPVHGEVSAWLSLALADVKPTNDDQMSMQDARRLGELSAKVYDAHGVDGLFWLAVSAAHMSVDGFVIHQRWAARLSGFGPHGDMPAFTTVEENLAQFVDAVLAEDIAAARRIFGRVEVVFGSRLLEQFLALLLQRALSRAAGGKLRLTVQPTGPWPPVCDFCCGWEVATRMFHCEHLDEVAMPQNLGGGNFAVSIPDIEFWYACGPCAALVEADRWTGLAARYYQEVAVRWAQERRGTPPDPEPLFDVFRALREDTQSVPLPDQRPEPTKR